MATVKLKRGDNLTRIAKRFPSPGKSLNQRIAEIAAANGITNANKVREGQPLVIPGGMDSPVATPPVMPTAGAMPAAPPQPIDTRIEDVGGMRSGRMDADLAQRQQTIADALMNSPNSPGAVQNRGTSAMASTGQYAPQDIPPVPGADFNVPSLLPDSPDIATELMRPPPQSADQVTGLPDAMNIGSGKSLLGEYAPDVLPRENLLTDIGAYPVPDPGTNDYSFDAMSIGPTTGFGAGQFGPTPAGGADPELMAIMNDPVRRQQMIQMLMAQGPGM
jgi:hypothetical protein